MTIESVEKRDRRIARERNKLRRFQHAVGALGKTQDALHHIYTFSATWESAIRVASEIISYSVKDVPTSWAIIGFVGKLPDGKARIETAIEAAAARWESELEVPL